jgi:hypothetical protein
MRPNESYALTRRSALRKAGNRYQDSLKSRHKHAQRIRLWRARSEVRVNKVAHHSGAALSTSLGLTLAGIQFILGNRV